MWANWCSCFEPSCTYISNRKWHCSTSWCPETKVIASKRPISFFWPSTNSVSYPSSFTRAKTHTQTYPKIFILQKFLYFLIYIIYCSNRCDPRFLCLHISIKIIFIHDLLYSVFFFLCTQHFGTHNIFWISCFLFFFLPFSQYQHNFYPCYFSRQWNIHIPWTRAHRTRTRTFTNLLSDNLLYTHDWTIPQELNIPQNDTKLCAFTRNLP